uniref:DNA-directed RNA polymerase n=1 Tax=Haemonchus contortus TaxID=6289 RepID=A0A7I4Z2J2_HAECO
MACRRLYPEQTWRRIEGESKQICNSIRSRAKSALCAKYDRLLGTHRGNARKIKSRSPMEHRLTDEHARSEREVARVTVLGDAQLSSNALDHLSLGPSFSPAQNINAATFCKVVGYFYRLRDLLRCNDRRERSLHPTANQRSLPTAPFPRMFYKEPDPVPNVDVKVRMLSTGVLNVLNQHRRHQNSNLTFQQRQEFREIRELGSNGTIRISVSDKGGELVVMPQSLDRAITEIHLRHTTT